MEWFTYEAQGEVFVIAFPSDTKVVSGIGEEIPEYVAWVDAGNKPKPWNPQPSE